MFIEIVLGAFLAALGWLIKTLLARINKIEEKLTAHILEDAKIQTELKNTLDTHGKEISDKLDKIIDELNY